MDAFSLLRELLVSLNLDLHLSVRLSLKSSCQKAACSMARVLERKAQSVVSQKGCVGCRNNVWESGYVAKW